MMYINIDASVHKRYGTVNSTSFPCINACLSQGKLNNIYNLWSMHFTLLDVLNCIQCALPVLSCACILASDNS